MELKDKASRAINIKLGLQHWEELRRPFYALTTSCCLVLADMSIVIAESLRLGDETEFSSNFSPLLNDHIQGFKF
jgi:hypothetical protein